MINPPAHRKKLNLGVEAYGFDGKLVKKLHRLRVHLVGVGGADKGTCQRNGYAEAMIVQIDHGIFDYCGTTVVTSRLIFESDTQGLIHSKEAVRSRQRIFYDFKPKLYLEVKR